VVAANPRFQRRPIPPRLTARDHGEGRSRLITLGTEARARAVDDTGLLQALKRACKRLGLAAGKVHALRHYFVCALFETGASAPEVRDLAGHSSLAVTERYAHTRTERLREAVLRLDRARGNSVATAAGGN